MITYHAARWAVMVTAGFLILATGLAMIVLPGPAIMKMGVHLLRTERTAPPAKV